MNEQTNKYWSSQRAQGLVDDATNKAGLLKYTSNIWSVKLERHAQ